MFHKGVVNFSMTRNRLLLACGRVEKDIMTRPMTVKDAAGFRKLTDELAASHTVISFV